MLMRDDSKETLETSFVRYVYCVLGVMRLLNDSLMYDCGVQPVGPCLCELNEYACPRTPMEVCGSIAHLC